MDKKMDMYIKKIRAILKQGPLLGSEIADRLTSEENISRTNARQILLRIKNKRLINTTDPVKFRHNEVLYFLNGQTIKRKLREILPDHAKTIDRIYQALVEQDGVLFWPEFCKISAGAVNNEKTKRKDVGNIFREIKELGIVKNLENYNNIPVIIANEEWVPNLIESQEYLERRYKELKLSLSLTEDLLLWLERINFIGWNSERITSQDDYKTGYNGFYFDAIAYCYLWGLYTTDKKEDLYNPSEEKRGSVVPIEVIVHREVKRHDVYGLINRVDNIYGPMKEKYKANFKVLPIIFAYSIEEEALKIARKKGIMVIRLVEVFGTKVLEGIEKLKEMNIENVDPKKLVEILEVIDQSGQEGKIGSLRGYVFNFICAYLFSQYGHRTIVGKKYTHPDDVNKKCECDIVINEDDDILIVCEVKGYKSEKEVKLGIDQNERDSVKKFFEHTCNIASKATGKKVLPVFITSSKFEDKAITYMEEYEQSKKISDQLSKVRFPGGIYYDREKLFNLFGSSSKYTDVKRILKEFF